SPTLGSSFFASFPSQDNQESKHPVLDDVRKAEINLERLVMAADAYRDLMDRLSKASKNFSKALKDYGNGKGLETTYDFDLLQKLWDKYSKKAVKDEKAHNDYVGDLDRQIKKIGKDYEKKTKRDNQSALDRAKTEYTNEVIKRERKTHSVVSQAVCRLTEGLFASFNDSLKKCGPCITKMKEWAPFASEDMPPPQSLDDFLEDQVSYPKYTSSEKIFESLAAISEKQIAAMNYSSLESTLPEPTLPIIDDDPDSNIPTRYVQMPSKISRTNTPETSKPIPVKPSTLSSETITPLSRQITQNYNNINNKSSPSSTSSSTLSQPSNSKSSTSNLISKFSIGIHANDDPFLRDEKVVEIKTAELFTENRVEKAVFKPNIIKVKTEEKPIVKATSFNEDNEVKEISFNRDNEVKETSFNSYNEIKETSINRDREVKENSFIHDNEVKETTSFNRDNEVKETTSFNRDNEVKETTSFNRDNEVKETTSFNSDNEAKEILFHRDNEVNKTTLFNSDNEVKETSFNRDNEVKETASFKCEEVKETLFNRDNEVKETIFNRDNEIKETTSFKREEVKETLFNRDNEVKETTFNHDNEIKETSLHYNKVKETTSFVDIVNNQLELPGIKKGETNDLAIINQPKQVENSLPIMTPPPVENFVPSRKAISSHGGLRRYINEPVHNPVPHRYEDQDSYESYDYIPSRLSSSYNSLDLPSPRQHDLHPHRAYTDPSKRGPSVADMRDRFMSMSDERRSVSNKK
ncbi:10022_t:CDS:2, partial [Racocetra fulgida]